MVFSEYIKSTLNSAEAESAGRLTRVQDEAVDIRVKDDDAIEVGPVPTTNRWPFVHAAFKCVYVIAFTVLTIYSVCTLCTGHPHVFA